MDKNQKRPLTASLHTLTPLRLAIYYALFTAILFGSLGYTFVKKNSEWNKVEERMEQMLFLAHKSHLRQKEIDGVRNHYKKVNSNYLQHQLAALSLLEKEQRSIERVIESPGFCGSKPLESRLRFLVSQMNAMQFKEQPLYTSSDFKEVEVSLVHPVEGSLEDVEVILKRIEEEGKKKPLLLTTHLSLKRKKVLDHNEVFEINFTVLKREFLDS